MTADLVRVPFHGGALVAAMYDGRPHVSVRHVCDALGLDVRSQLRKLSSRSWAVVVKVTMTAADGKNYETAVVDSRTLAMWLATINANQVADEVRPILDTYQSEAADALDAYFTRGGVAVRANDLSSLDVLRRAIDEIEVAQRDAAEAKAIAATTAARLDAIEGRHDWFAALGYARLAKVQDTSASTMARLGRVAGRISREARVEPVRVPHAVYGHINQYPRWALEAAVDELGLVPA